MLNHEQEKITNYKVNEGYNKKLHCDFAGKTVDNSLVYLNMSKGTKILKKFVHHNILLSLIANLLFAQSLIKRVLTCG
jgi:hypothetical protein